MAETIRELILDALESDLRTTLTGVIVERNRDTEVERFPSVILMDGPHFLTTDNHFIDDVEMEVAVELYVQGSAGGPNLGTLLNDLYGRVVEAMLADRQINALAIDIEEVGMDQPEPVRAQGQGPAMGSTVDFTVRYHRAVGDPFNVAP